MTFQGKNKCGITVSVSVLLLVCGVDISKYFFKDLLLSVLKRQFRGYEEEVINISGFILFLFCFNSIFSNIQIAFTY